MTGVDEFVRAAQGKRTHPQCQRFCAERLVRLAALAAALVAADSRCGSAQSDFSARTIRRAMSEFPAGRWKSSAVCSGLSGESGGRSMPRPADPGLYL